MDQRCQYLFVLNFLALKGLGHVWNFTNKMVVTVHLSVVIEFFFGIEPNSVLTDRVWRKLTLFDDS